MDVILLQLPALMFDPRHPGAPERLLHFLRRHTVRGSPGGLCVPAVATPLRPTTASATDASSLDGRLLRFGHIPVRDVLQYGRWTSAWRVEVSQQHFHQAAEHQASAIPEYHAFRPWDYISPLTLRNLLTALDANESLREERRTLESMDYFFDDVDDNVDLVDDLPAQASLDFHLADDLPAPLDFGRLADDLPTQPLLRSPEPLPLRENLPLYTQDCAICLESVAARERVPTLQCAHVFHALCLEAWRNAGGDSCPSCRARLSEEKKK